MTRTPVLLDIAPAVHQGAGLARYAERLATHLAAEQGERVDLRLFYNAHSGHPLPAELAAQPAMRQPPLTVPASQLAWRLSVLAGQVLRRSYGPIATRMGLGEVYHATEHLLPRLPGPTVLTVHDLIFERYPQHHTLRNRLFLRVGMPLFVQAADAIIAVSQHTRRDLVELYGADAAKIQVIYEGIDARFAPATAADVQRVQERYSPNRPYLLMVGTLEPRKNHRAALLALAQLKRWGWPHRLLLVGGKGWLFEPVQAQIAELGLEQDVTLAGYVPDADLPPLYTGAACALAPSLYEGFGFPALEAMACGAPVVCSNVSSLPEVAGEAALLVAPQDDLALAQAVALILSQPSAADLLRTRGLAQARTFQWAQCAAATADLYAEVGRRTAGVTAAGATMTARAVNG